MATPDRSPWMEEAEQFRAMAAAARDAARRIEGDARTRMEQMSARYERFARDAEDGLSA